ncbi:unnamed protein product [Rotaria sp. Silwood2]|nr:unnamed protein product [Rotaria sp. Silwood2]CAF2885509.1 unnamed protein product [Rotaria sp. Silwood2]
MADSTLAILCISYACTFTMCLVSLCISKYFNSPRLFQLNSIVSSTSIIFIYVFLKLKSSWFDTNTLWAFSFSGLSMLTAFKFLELAFAYNWTYTRKMPLKLVAVYLLALPQMPESEAKLSELSKQQLRLEGILLILRGICQFIILRIFLDLTPFEWLSLSSSLCSPIFRFFRYGLCSVLLYLSIDYATGIGFGIYTILFNLQINPVYPVFPFVSTSLRDFWSCRWNNLVKTSLQRISFVVVPKLINPVMSMNHRIKGLFAFVLSGFLHEYTLWFASSKWSGKTMIFFSLHGVLVLLEITMKLPVKPNTFQGKLLGWMWTIGILLITAPLFFDPFIEAGVFSAMK